MTKKSVRVNLRLGSAAVENSDDLMYILGIASRTTVIQMAAALMHSLVTHMKNGDQVIIRQKDGTEQLMFIPGLS